MTFVCVKLKKYIRNYIPYVILLKIPHTLTKKKCYLLFPSEGVYTEFAGYSLSLLWRNQTDIDMKVHLYWLTSIVLEVSMHITGRSYHKVSNLVSNNNWFDKYAHWLNAGMNFMRVTKYFLIAFKTCSIRRAHAWYH